MSIKRKLSPNKLAGIVAGAVALTMAAGCQTRGTVEVPVESLFPQNCAQAGFYYDDEGKIVLDPKERGQHLYYFRNLGHSKVWMNNTSNYKGFNDGFDTFLSSNGRMSALALDTKPFKLVCSSSRMIGFEKNVPCQEYVALCQVQHPKFMAGANGTYWITQNSLEAEFKHDLKLRGF